MRKWEKNISSYDQMPGFKNGLQVHHDNDNCILHSFSCIQKQNLKSIDKSRSMLFMCNVQGG